VDMHDCDLRMGTVIDVIERLFFLAEGQHPHVCEASYLRFRGEPVHRRMEETILVIKVQLQQGGSFLQELDLLHDGEIRERYRY
jgi:hypothetical protein